MVRVLLVESATGRVHEVQAAAPTTLMQAAKAAGVPGIDADCGGSMVCGTCHVYVDPDWFGRLAPAQAMEREILDCVPSAHPQARLSCQIPLEPGLDGLRVSIPITQR